MKSPFTGGEVILKQEKSELIFRKEKYQYAHLYYECVDTKERFTTTKMDEKNLFQVYNQYRIKYGIPFPDEIRKTREMYDLSASKMSKILGFGDNQYRLYENGDIPSEANGKILSLITTPSVFKDYIKIAKNQFEEREYNKILLKLDHSIENSNSKEYKDLKTKAGLIFDSYSRGVLNGYVLQSYSKLKNIILFFIQKCGPTYITKMNKLLFYSDFLSYKSHGYGMSGLAYKAIQFGPVPLRWDRVYSLIDEITTEIVELPYEHGSKLCSKFVPDESNFSKDERYILEKVVDKFKDVSASEISKLSHNEEAWKNNLNNDQIINYNEAFTLQIFET